jgi:hypothetical protein
MARSHALPAALAFLALLAALAGCTASPGTGPATTASTTTPTTPSGSPTATTAEARTTAEPRRTGTAGCPYYLTVEPATDRQIEQAETIRTYANLSAARQSEFDRARTSQNGTITMETLPPVWGQPRVVEFENELYATVAATC